MTEQSADFVITREDRSTTNGRPTYEGRCYVTGPHFGRSIFSSTADPDKASRYTREDAERLLAQGKWRGLDPRIEASS